MPIRVDRPAGGAGDDVVVFVARSLDEARGARDALVGAGIACDLPDAALEALFSQGAASLPVRVPAADFSRAADVIDARFPPPEPVDLPPPPAAAAPAPRVIALGDPPRDDDEPDERALDEAAAKAQGERLARTALKVAGIAIAGFLLPGFGALAGALAVVAAAWCFQRADRFGGAGAPLGRFEDVRGTVRFRAGLAGALGVAAVAWNVVWVATWWAGRQ